MALLIAVVYFFNIPNPNMILIAGLVICSALFGFRGGIPASAIMFFYTLFFFSTGHDFVTFDTQNKYKVLVSLIGIAVDMVFVCELKRNEIKYHEEISKLTCELRIENEKLNKLSLTDALTGIKNRLALRRDFDGYLGHTLHIVMIDVNDFKSINDSLGHSHGDAILKKTAEILKNVFGEECCYRYGGDEFLIIDCDSSDKEFEEKLAAMDATEELIEYEDGATDVKCSKGYVSGVATNGDEFRILMRQADERMYEAKREAKAVKEISREGAFL
ncbi:MAG: diguanylate cyclase [Clostridia bacterium]|nr:diguanylate cyclase [Clostridia bacterium]